MSSTSLPAQIWAPLQPCSLGAHLGGRTWCSLGAHLRGRTWCNRFGTAALAARIAHGIAQGVGAAGALCRSDAPSLMLFSELCTYHGRLRYWWQRVRPRTFKDWRPSAVKSICFKSLNGMSV